MRRNRWRLAALTLGSVVAAVAVAACGSSSNVSSDSGVLITPIASIITATPPPPVLQPTSAAQPGGIPTPPPTSTGGNGAALHGFTYPIAGGCLPQGDQLMPNAPRTYRNGIHEGVDFYAVDNCTGITRGTPVLAAKAGHVIRADLDYVDITAAEVAAYTANPNTEEALDNFRGRQVWVDHGGGIVTRYAHLSGIAPGITVGVPVAQGQLIAFVGESGTPESITNPGTEYHLHFELRSGDSFLGKGLPPADVRGLYLALFAP